METRVHVAPPVLRESEKGFVVAGSLLLMTTALVILIFIFFYHGVNQANLKVKASCRSASVQHQKKMRSILAKLLKMNPKALSLRRQYFAAQKRLQKALLTGTPPIIAAAEAHLLLIEMARIVHDGKQKLLLSQAKLSAHSFAVRLKQQIRNGLRSRARIQIIEMDLAVEPDVSGPAPQYLMRADFVRAQRAGAVWKAPLIAYLPGADFFKRQSAVKLPFQSQWENSCAATLEERRPRQFYVAITAAK